MAVILLPETLAALQAEVDTFDHLYNAERPHQGLPGRVTPQQAWGAAPKAEAPHPKPVQPLLIRSAPKQLEPTPPPTGLPAGVHLRTLNSGGAFTLANVTYIVGGQLRNQQVLAVVEGDTITVTNLDGEVVI